MAAGKKTTDMAIFGYPTRNAYTPYGISVFYIEHVVQRDNKQYIATDIDVLPLGDFLSLFILIIL